nr:cGMP-specific 3',5'-cyclic phosphodiesterase-like isoform X3 [Dermatophagoides farinae]
MTNIDENQVRKYLNENYNFSRDWFIENANGDIIREWFNCRKKSSNISEKDEQTNNGNRWLMKNLSILSNQLSTSNTSEQRDPNSITKELLDNILDRNFRKSANSEKIRVTTSEKRRKLVGLSEEQLLVELIIDIINELDVDILCHKILTNVSVLINCDRASLFLAKGNRKNRYLVAKLFDVTPDSQLQDALVVSDNNNYNNNNNNSGGRPKVPPIPFGTGIVGHVAKTKESVNIKNVYQDSRFHKEIDIRTGYHTKSLICQPIVNSSGDVIGVAECVNKLSDESCFTENDEKVKFTVCVLISFYFMIRFLQIFRKYLTFCGFSIQNAQLFQLSILEYKRYQLLLNIAKVIFEDTTNLETMVKKIIEKTKTLLDIDKCRVYIMSRQQISDDHNNEIKNMFEAIFELDSDTNQVELIRIEENDNGSDVPSYYAQQAAVNRKTLNSDELLLLEPVVDSNLSILSVPIFNNENKLLGIAQLIKTESKVFTDAETGVIEAFSIFCGLGLQSCLIYEEAIKLNAQQQISLEILAYHASANEEEATLFMNNKIPLVNVYHLDSFDFDDIEMNDDETVAAFIRIFMELNFLETFKISYKVLCRWILTVRKNYRRVIYHNWRHALNVAQTMFVIIEKCKLKEILNQKERFALIVASICHDLDHRGLNNSFQAKTSHPLTKIYSTSYMENHHFNCTMLILNLEGNNILENVSSTDREEIIKIIEQCILSTDLAEYIRKNKKFADLIQSAKMDLNDLKNKELLRDMLMTACDLSAICKPWPIQKRIASLVADEFYLQGDLETRLNLNPLPIMDRKQKANLPQGQVGFIDNICLPLYQILSEFRPRLKPLYDGCLANRKMWQELMNENGIN